MSVRVLSEVFRTSKSTGAARLVLLALADVSSDGGEISAYARSHSTLAAKANCDERTVTKSIRALQDLGELEVTTTGDGRARSDYQIHLPAIGRGCPEATPPPARRHPRDAQAPSLGCPEAIPITPSLLDTGPSPSVDSAREDFETWWLGYPKRDGSTRGPKKTARAAWDRLSAADRAAAVSAVPHYAEATDQKFVCDAVRFLTQRRFDEWQEPGRPRGSSWAGPRGRGPEHPLTKEEREAW